MSTVLELQPGEILGERVRHVLDTRPDIEMALTRYARDLGVAADHVILGALLVVAQEYNRVTGNGTIPRLNS